MNGTTEAQATWPLGGSESATAPLDVALEYLRRRLDRVLGLYVIAAAPMTLVMLRVIDAVTAEHRRGIGPACLLLSIATVWRWVWQAAIQRRVQQELRGEPPRPLRPHLLSIIWLRLVSNLLVTWGGLLVLPSIYGLILSGFAAPVVLERGDGPVKALATAMGWVHRNIKRTTRITAVLSVLSLLGLLGIVGLHVMLLGTVLPSLLGIDTATVRLTVSGLAWWMSVGWFAFLVFDLYWTVASVMIFYDLQSTRLGTDLARRLASLDTPA